MKKRILLFIPMYNCEKQIVRVLKQIGAEEAEWFSEIIVVNNRSTDNSEAAAIRYCQQQRKLPVKVFRNDNNYGLGGSHKVAFQYAIDNGFDYIVVLHGDDQGRIDDILPYLKSGRALKYDSFLGSRFERQSKLINYSKVRILGNLIFNIFMTLCLKRRITDLGSGLNMYRVDYLRSGFYKTFINNLTFNVYMLIYGVYSKSKFAFFPLSWREEDQISNAKFVRQAREISAVALKYFFCKNRLFSVQNNELSRLKYTYRIVYDYRD